MKKLITLALTTLLLALGVAVAPAANAWSNRDYQYVRAVRSEAPAFKAVPMRDLVKIAKLNCQALRGGWSSVVDLVDEGLDAGFTQKQAIALVAGAVVFYCPDQDPYI